MNRKQFSPPLCTYEDILISISSLFSQLLQNHMNADWSNLLSHIKSITNQNVLLTTVMFLHNVPLYVLKLPGTSWKQEDVSLGALSVNTEHVQMHQWVRQIKVCQVWIHCWDVTHWGAESSSIGPHYFRAEDCQAIRCASLKLGDF